MKKTKILIPLLALGLLAGCGGTSTSSTPTSSSEPETVIVTVRTFEEQLKAAGIEGYTYVDPNADIYKTETKPAEGEEDVVAGASGEGTDFYPASGGGSYYTLDYMVTRANLKYYHYYWSESEEGAKTLAEASKLENAQYVSDLFPNDGKTYSVASYSNAVATKTLVTIDNEGNLSASIYGMGASKIDNNYYITGALTNKKTVANLVKNGKGLVVMYEYNPTSNDKTGPGGRNFGCRLAVELDFDKTTFSTSEGAVTLKLGDDVPSNLSAAMVKLKVTTMYTLG